MFNPKDKNRLLFLEEERKIKSELKELSVVANNILNDQRYVKFSKIIQDAERNTIDLLLRFKEDDPYKFKSKVDEYLVELRVYRNILNSAKDLTNPEPKPNINFMQRFLENYRNNILGAI